MNDLTIKVIQYRLLHVSINRLVWIITIIWRDIEVRTILLSETIEQSRISCGCAIESPLQWNNTSHRIILHII